MEGFGPAARYTKWPFLAVPVTAPQAQSRPACVLVGTHTRGDTVSIATHSAYSAADAISRLIIQVSDTVSARTYDTLYLLSYLLTTQASPQSSVIPTVMSPMMAMT